MNLNDFFERIELASQWGNWSMAEAEAKQKQVELAKAVKLDGKLAGWNLIAGIDVGYSKDNQKATASVVILDQNLEPIEAATAESEAAFPYIPGLLSFREIPVILKAMKKLSHVPEVLICDGAGYAHPRRFGLACHLGVLLGIASIGAAKTPYVGEHEEPGWQKGSYEYLLDQGEVVGAALRTRDNTKPLYISPGHLCTVEESISMILAVTGEVRQPEPIRLAHHIAGGGSMNDKTFRKISG